MGAGTLGPRILALAVGAALISAACARVQTAADVGAIFVASCAGSVVQKLALYPLDTIKTRAQYYRRPLPSGAAARQRGAAEGGACVQPGPPAAEPGLAAVRDLYRGLTPTLLGVLPVSLVYMPTYELARALAIGLPPAWVPLARVLAGSVAGLACSVVQVPSSVLKARMQVRAAGAGGEGVRAVAREIWASEGARGFYAGWASAAALDVLYSTLQFLVLERTRTVALALAAGGGLDHCLDALLSGAGTEPRGVLRRGRALRAWENSAVGCVTGALTAALTEPLDVAKTRLMTQPAARRTGVAGVGGGAEGERRYAGTVDCLRTIARAEGLSALWRGLAPRVAYTALKSALWYGTYETVRALLVTLLGGLLASGRAR